MLFKKKSKEKNKILFLFTFVEKKIFFSREKHKFYLMATTAVSPMMFKMIKKTLEHFVDSDFENAKLILLLEDRSSHQNNNNDIDQVVVCIKQSEHFDCTTNNGNHSSNNQKRFKIKTIHQHDHADYLLFDNYTADQTIAFIQRLIEDGHRVLLVNLHITSLNRRGCCLYSSF